LFHVGEDSQLQFVERANIVVQGGGLHLFFSFALFWNTIPVLAPSRPLTAELADQVHRSGQVTASFLPPSVLEDISQDAELWRGLSGIRYCLHAGAHLPRSAGEILKQHTRLINLLGQTEVGMPYQLMVDSDDYEYIHPGRYSGAEFRHRYEDLYELVIVQTPELQGWQTAFLTFPEMKEVATRDLFSRHPDPAKLGLWKHRGRYDDIIVFDNGEKLNPVTMEKIIENHPSVRTAIIVGHGRFQAALLVEPRDPEAGAPENSTAFIEDLWPTIEKANIDCPHHGRLVKELIVVAGVGKPFPRTAKDSKTRKGTVDLYHDEINEIYAAAEQAGPESDSDLVIDLEAPHEELRERLTQLITLTTSLDSLDERTDLFEAGVDSLQALQLSRKLRTALRNDPAVARQIKPSLVYRNPTSEMLLEAIYKLQQQTPTDSATGQSRFRKIEIVVRDLSKDLQLSAVEQKRVGQGGTAVSVLLTGSTGGLGSYLLSGLLGSPFVAHVFCLNRSHDAVSRQVLLNRSRGLIHNFDPARVTFLQADFSKPYLGIGHQKYSQLTEEVTHIIHNAWTVDFNRSFDSFLSTDLARLTNLVQLAASSKCDARLLFVSSIGTMTRWHTTGHTGPVPELISKNPEVVDSAGYAESKYVAERVLLDACAHSRIKATVLRVGQIAGPVKSTKGCWNPKEWFPALVTSAKIMRKLPNQLRPSPQIDWIPVDVLSDITIEILHNEPPQRQELSVYNLVNPRYTPWPQLYPVVKQFFDKSGGNPIEVVDWSSWLNSLRDCALNAETKEDVNRNPAIKLLEFFEAYDGPSWKPTNIVFATDNAEHQSRTLSTCQTVTPEWMSIWMEQWGKEAEAERDDSRDDL